MSVIELISLIDGKGNQAPIPSITVAAVRRPPREREQKWSILVGLVFLFVWFGTGRRGRCWCRLLRDTGPELHPALLLVPTRMKSVGVILHVRIDIMLVVVPHGYGRKRLRKFRGRDD